MVKLYTARYSYYGEDRIDITRKGAKHLCFAPTWDMVFKIKNGVMSEEMYTRLYLRMMKASYMHYRKEWIDILNMEEATFVCFCNANTFCHRYLLKDLFVDLGAEYMGERKV